MAKYVFTREECQEWASNPAINPRTKRKIDVNPTSSRAIYNQLLEQCKKMGIVPQVGELVEQLQRLTVRKTTPTTDKKSLSFVKNPNRMWSNMSRDQVLELAGRVLAEDPEAQAQAVQLHQSYCDRKKRINGLFDKYKAQGKLENDEELELAGDVIGRFCRCVQSIKGETREELSRL